MVRLPASRTAGRMNASRRRAARCGGRATLGACCMSTRGVRARPRSDVPAGRSRQDSRLATPVGWRSALGFVISIVTGADPSSDRPRMPARRRPTTMRPSPSQCHAAIVMDRPAAEPYSWNSTPRRARRRCRLANELRSRPSSLCLAEAPRAIDLDGFRTRSRSADRDATHVGRAIPRPTRRRAIRVRCESLPTIRARLAVALSTISGGTLPRPVVEGGSAARAPTRAAAVGSARPGPGPARLIDEHAD